MSEPRVTRAEEDTPWLNLYIQYMWHSPAVIKGTKEGLLALREAIDLALKNGVGVGLRQRRRGIRAGGPENRPHGPAGQPRVPDRLRVQSRAHKPTKKERQDAFIRVCRDSGFQMEHIQAGILAGRILNCNPLEIWTAFGNLSIMERIAAGEHPASRRALHQESSHAD